MSASSIRLTRSFLRALPNAAQRPVRKVLRVPRVDAEGFWHDGFTIVPSVYTAEEVAQFRDDIESTSGPMTDLLAHDKLHRVLTDGRLVDIASEILGEGPIVYAGDSSFTVGMKQRGFHKDNADRKDGNAPDWNGRYTILRFGVYLQDHFWHGGGLNLRVGSHGLPSHDVGKNEYVRTKVGDVGVWSLRITHSGNGRFFRFPKWTTTEPADRRERPRWWVEAPSDCEPRMALFAALGLDDAHHRRYVEYLKTRSYICAMWRNSEYSTEALAEAAEGGLVVRNLPAEIADDQSVGRNKSYEPLPY